MSDTLTTEERSKRMSLVKSKDTKPEMRVRKLVHSLGYRYRLHARYLPGYPDLVFPGRRKVIFVHGCFWHQHDCSMGCRIPKSRIDFWKNKLEGNRKRDETVLGQLRHLNWKVMTIWECETMPSRMRDLTGSIRTFLES